MKQSVTYQRPVEATLHVAFADGTTEPATPADLERFGVYPKFEGNITWDGVTVDLGAGTSIHQAARQMATLAAIVAVPVAYEFNGHRLKVDPGMSAAQVVDGYHASQAAALRES